MWGVRCDWFMTLSKVSWSDGNSIMSHYLSLLSTELNNRQDYSVTLKELYYAMLAMERLDLYSESHWRKFKENLILGAKTEKEQKQNKTSQIPIIKTHSKKL